MGLFGKRRKKRKVFSFKFLKKASSGFKKALKKVGPRLGREG